MNLSEAKQVANDTNKVIRPVSDEGYSPYAFKVVNWILYDSKEKMEKDKNWEGWEFIIEDS